MRNIIFSILFLNLLLTANSNKLYAGEIKMNCNAWVGFIFYPLTSLFEGISRMWRYRTSVVKINDTSVEVLSESITWHDQRKKIPSSVQPTTDFELIINKRKIVVRRAGKVEFYPDGNLMRFNGEGSFISGNNHEIIAQGDIVIYQNGSLKSAGILKENAISLPILKTERMVIGDVELDRQGLFISGNLLNNESIIGTSQILNLPAGTHITVNSDQLISFNAYTIAGVEVKTIYGNMSAFRADYFDEYHFKKITLATNTAITVNNTRLIFSYSSELKFYPDGCVRSGRLYGDQEVSLSNGNQSIKAREVVFYPDGNIYYADYILLYDRRGWPYRTRAWFNKAGKPFIVEGIYVNSDNQTHRGKKLSLGTSDLRCLKADNDSEIDFLGLTLDSIKIRNGIIIPPTSEIIFVRAQLFEYENDPLTGLRRLVAEGVEELMFTDDTEIIIDGNITFCRMMNWIKI